jgi:hypothetical protein
MANFNKTICKRHRVTIASRRAHRVITTDDDNSDTITTTVAGIEPGASTGSGSHRHRINRHGADRRRDHRERTAVASRHHRDTVRASHQRWGCPLLGRLCCKTPIETTREP